MKVVLVRVVPAFEEVFMRFLVLAAILFLAACGSAATPTPTLTATAIPATEAPTGAPVSLGEDTLATLGATLNVPAPGTLVVPRYIETPNAPTAEPITIDQLGFSQSGGLDGQSLTIVLKGDGTLTRNGQTSQVSQDAVRNLAALLDSIHFFDLTGIFTGANVAPDTYRYTVAVESAGRRRTISSQDGMTPPELMQLYDAIRSLGSP
jgi:hypothetical protein